MVKATCSYSKLTDVAGASPEEIKRYTDLLVGDLNEVKDNLNALLSGGKSETTSMFYFWGGGQVLNHTHRE